MRHTIRFITRPDATAFAEAIQAIPDGTTELHILSCDFSQLEEVGFARAVESIPDSVSKICARYNCFGDQLNTFCRGLCMTQVTHLNLGRNKLFQNQANTLEGLAGSQVEYLDLSLNSMSQLDQTQLRTILSNLAGTRVRCVRLSDNGLHHLSVQDLEALSKILFQDAKLSKIILNENLFDTAKLKALYSRPDKQRINFVAATDVIRQAAEAPSRKRSADDLPCLPIELVRKIARHHAEDSCIQQVQKGYSTFFDEGETPESPARTATTRSLPTDDDLAREPAARRLF